MKDEEKYTPQALQNSTEKTTQSTPARTRTRNNNIITDNNTAINAGDNTGFTTRLNAMNNADKRELSPREISNANLRRAEEFSNATEEQAKRARELGRKGGINSGIARKANGSIRAAVRRYLEECGDDSGLTRADAVGKRLINIATIGEDKNAVKAADLITDLIGERVQKLEVDDRRTVANWRQLPPSADTDTGEDHGDVDDLTP